MRPNPSSYPSRRGNIVDALPASITPRRLLQVVVRLSIPLFLLFFAKISTAFADQPPIEELVINDCNEAGIRAGHLSDARLSDELAILVQAIRIGIQNGTLIKTDSRPFPSLSGGSVGRSHGELSGDSVILSLDPERNQRARLCIFMILRAFIPRVPTLLRDLMSLADEPDIALENSEIRIDIASLVLEIASAHPQSFASADRIVILEQLIGTASPEILGRWIELFRLWDEESAQLLAKRFITSDAEDDRIQLLPLVAQTDRHGLLSLKTAQQFIDSSSDPERRSTALRLIGALNPRADRTIPLLLFSLAYRSPVDARGIVNLFSSIRFDISCPVTNVFELVDSHYLVDALSQQQVQLWEGLRTRRRGVICPQQSENPVEESGITQVWCDSRLLRELKDQIAHLISLDSPRLGVIINSAVSLPLSQSETLTIVQRALHSQYPFISAQAVPLYGQLSIDKARFVSDVLRLLKRPTVKFPEKRLILESLAESFVSPPIGVKGLPAIPLFLDMLDTSEDECGKLCERKVGGIPLLSEAIASVGSSAFPLLGRSLSSSSIIRKRRSLYALSRMGEFDKKMSVSLVSALRDPSGEIRLLAEQLIRKKMDVRDVESEIDKALGWTDKEAVARARIIKNDFSSQRR